MSQSAPTIVNILVDYDTPPHPTSEMLNESRGHLTVMTNEFNSRDINATFFLTREVASSKERGFLAMLGLNLRYELAMGGNTSGERLSTVPYSDQKALLEQVKRWVDLAHFCDVNSINSGGFKPQLFDQNEDTFKVLDELNMTYDAGFKSGVLYMPGHEGDVWPYPVEGHNFYAVPVSTYDLSGEKVLMHDKYLKDERKLSAQELSNVLIGKFDQAASKKEPMIVIFSLSISASGDYLGAMEKFLDYAASKNSKFVTTMELVNITKAGAQASVLSRPISESAGTSVASLEQSGSNATGTNATSTVRCSVCDSMNNSVDVIPQTANYSIQSTVKLNETPRKQ